MSDFRRLLACEVDEAASAGFVLLGVSAFDHVLTEAECADVPFFFHRQARERGQEAEFLVIERRFIAMLDSLAKDGAALVHRPARLMPLRADAARYRAFVRRSLREKFTSDLYFPEFGVRWIFGFDMTHWIILPDATRADEVKALAQAAGLHIHVAEGL